MSALRGTGNVLAIMCRVDGAGRHQAVILAGRIEKPDDLDEVHASDWHATQLEAQAAVMPVYFQIYAHREGFKHPEDPTRTDRDRRPHRHLVCLKGV